MLYVYGLDGELLAEVDAGTGQTQREYEYQGDKMASQYQYNPFLIGKDTFTTSKVELCEDEVRQSKPQYQLICFGSSSRYPLWIELGTNQLVGGNYHCFYNDDELKALYTLFQQDAQRQGYSDQKQNYWAKTPNPFPIEFLEGMPQSLWAYFYESGRRQAACEKSVQELLPMFEK
ncbi:hypothetical protein DI392_13900 [Vibrio albus]|uniref:Uncharacterized protein n=4 Tax=Vibrio TaxID=662 RepID=A0A1P8DPN9_VIBAL|nr:MULTISPECIES: hypothetical protein [Vibrio]APU90873.1 hypothetical protein [Vibrio alginolyticus]PWI32904.1 hypothetical protein DI392_13900 [Vibrio albus]APU91084.1 hypothetical protein [Vibrio alginolyticus]APU91310.1 hypothetical protein [Vibrio parahaemolyticus]AVF73860.1 hypothetical protein AL539_08645 [Vibrio alginolyticus]